MKSQPNCCEVVLFCFVVVVVYLIVVGPDVDVVVYVTRVLQGSL